MPTAWSLAIRNADLTTRAALLNGGTAQLYDGERPANVDVAVTTQNLAVTLTFGNPAFGAASNGLITANALTGARGVYQPSATVTWGRCFASDGTTPICDFNCGASGSDMNLDNTLIPFNVMVTCSSFTLGESS
jgi:hypothetical protein